MTRRRTAAIGGTVAAIVVIVAVSTQAYLSLRELRHTFALVERTQGMLQEIAALRAAITDAETGQRGFVITGDESFLAPYNDALVLVPSTLERLRDFAGGAEARLEELTALIDERLAHIAATIAERRGDTSSYRPDEPTFLAGKAMMERIRALLVEIKGDAAQQYRTHREAVTATAELTGLVLLVGVALAIITIVLVLVQMQREARRRHASEASLRELNTALDARVAERTAELEAGNAVLGDEIARRQSVEERLRTSEERYRSVIELIQEAIWIHSGGRIVFANAHAMHIFGAPRVNDLVGKPVMDLVAPEDRSRAIERTHMLIHGRVAQSRTEMTMRRLDGQSFVAEIQAVPFVHEGQPAVLAAARDITERRLLEAQLHQAQKMEALGQLTGGIAHDFNNLLAIVVGNLELVAEEIGDDKSVRELIQSALHGALRGAELTNQLLTFSRRHELTLARVDVAALVGGLRSILQRALGERVTVRLRIADDMWPARTDSAQLESSLVNLAINARDAMPNGGTLSIDAANDHLDEHYGVLNPGVVPGDYVTVSVSDTGTGMPPEIADRAFEPFFTTKSAGKGTGLGLSMIYGFAKQSGGHVKIYSEPGAGTTVRLYLPRSDAAEVDEGPRVEASHAGRGETILVVEDNADVRAVAVGQLGRLGYAVLQAENGTAGLAVVESGEPIDLLFTDIVMAGGISGPELAQTACVLRPGLRVLFTTGFADIAQNGGTISAEDRILRKPYRLQDLAREIHLALADES